MMGSRPSVRGHGSGRDTCIPSDPSWRGCVDPPCYTTDQWESGDGTGQKKISNNNNNQSDLGTFETHRQAERLRWLVQLVVPEPSQKGSFCLSLHSLWKQITPIVEWIWGQ